MPAAERGADQDPAPRIDLRPDGVAPERFGLGAAERQDEADTGPVPDAGVENVGEVVDQAVKGVWPDHVEGRRRRHTRNIR